MDKAKILVRKDVIYILCFLILGFGSLAYLIFVASTARKGYPLHGDETFFATCAARGIVTGQWVISGCRDNKGPVIYIIYRLLAAFSHNPYDIQAFKAFAGVLVITAAMLTATVARNISDVRAASAGIFIGLLSVAANPASLVLNTDLVATTLIAIAVAILAVSQTNVSWRLFLAGLFVGLATMTKQSYVLFLLPIFGFIWLNSGQHGRTAWECALFNIAGFLLAGCGFAAYFFAVGELENFLASLFLYPLSYAISMKGQADSFVSYRLLSAGSIIDRAPLLSLLFVVALTEAARRILRIGARENPQQQTALPIEFALMSTAFLSLVLLFLAPNLDIRMATPYFIFAGAAGAIGASRMRSALPISVQHSIFAGLALLGVTGLLNVWGNNGPVRSGDKSFIVDQVPEMKGSFGYVYGILPQIYFFNGMMPASDVLYSSAFDGSVESLLGKPLTRNSLIYSWNKRMEQNNEGRLLKDFALTPPAYIVIGSSGAKLDNGQPASHVAGLDAYVHSHCRFLRPLTPPVVMTSQYEQLSLYGCRQ